MNISMKYRANRGRRRPPIGYDFETTRIKEGTPTPLFISTFDGTTKYGKAINGLSDLHDVIVTHFLTEDNRQSRFVGWNSNKFDAPFIVLAMIDDKNYSIEPWLAKSGNFRGMAIRSRENPKHCWHFSDGMAMFGFLGSLKEFLAKFAPEQSKMSIDILNFDSNNPEHVEYAINDSVALWHAVENASKYLNDVTGLYPNNTIGKTAIKYFESKIPKDVLVWEVPKSGKRILERCKRGGYVYCAGSYRGQIWKYDRNQAYAAAMREKLPSGRAIHTDIYNPDKLGMYQVIIHREDYSPIPFYIRDDRGRPIMTHQGVVNGFVLSIEVEYLRSHGWNVEILDGFYWTNYFTMSEMVNELEEKRMNCEGGPKGALGLMYKAIGTNAFGKTWEEHDGLRLVYAKEPKEGWMSYRIEDERYANIWMYKEEPRKESYHKPQIGTFITAYQRINLMETAWLAPHDFIYGDTDSNIFRTNVTHLMDIHESRYGAYKVEAENVLYGIINKKVLYSIELIDGTNVPKVACSKGIHVRDLTIEDFENWYNGLLPVQTQTQRQNINTTIAMGKMFVDRPRTGSFLLPRFDE